MTTYAGIAVAMAVGLFGTSVIHLSKGVMKHGVTLLRNPDEKRRTASFVYALGGGLAALEAVLKGVAQSDETGSAFLPQTPGNWWIFVVSFLGAAGAFGMIQWSYFRRCRVSMMATAYNVAYVTVPLVVVAIAIPGQTIGLFPVSGLALLAVGAIVMQIPARHSRRES